MRCPVAAGLGVGVRCDEAGTIGARWRTGHRGDLGRLDEFHPERTHLRSPNAPIVPGWYPYNGCTLWRCKSCAAAFLRYTEYGGYYEDERIRPLLADLIVTPEIGPS